ncbi:hypothetical protein CL614_04925 [archaeon]|nr:hypothetical protein [archaeon]
MAPEWDSDNRPKGYILSVTPGFASFEQGDARLTYMGLARKITKAARLGFEFAEIDFEELSEMFEPDITKQVQHIKDSQGMEVGLHLPVSMDLCLADAYQWKQNHEQLVYGAVAGAERMKSKFVLFHTSSNSRPGITTEIGQRLRMGKMAAWNGQNLGQFIEDNDMKNWFMAKFINVLFRTMGTSGDVGVVTYFDDQARKGFGFKAAKMNAEKVWREVLRKYQDQVKKDFISHEEKELAEIDAVLKKDPERFDLIRHKEALERRIGEIMTQDITELHGLRSVRDLVKKYMSDGDYKIYNTLVSVEEYTDRYDFYDIFRYWVEHGAECDEAVAYHVIAKWMYNTGDKLWKSIVSDSSDPDDIIYDADTSRDKTQKMMDTIKDIITAVAGKYIEGHLTTSTKDIGVPVDKKNDMFDKDSEEHKSVLEYCKDNKVHIFIETNMPGGYGEAGAPPGELRIIKATDHVKIVKAIDSDHMSYCMDFEHLLTNYVDPEKEAENLEDDQLGKYVRCLHINAPRPVKGAHGNIVPMSYDMYIIYRYIYKLRKAGVKNAYWVWEMGSYGVQDSAIAFRRINKELMKGTKPEDLPEEFFGIDKSFAAQQMTAIREHAYEPLKGMLAVPEQEHGYLSSQAVEKGKGMEWRKEKFK